MRKKIYIAIGIAAAVWSVVGGIVFAATLIQAADHGSGNTSFNRAFVCSQESTFCYTWGGGSSGTSAGWVDDTFRYNPTLDSWASGSIVELPVVAKFLYYTTGSFENLMIATETANNNSFLYDETSNTFQTISPPVGFSGNFGYLGVSAGEDYYLMEAVGGIFSAFRLDMTNPGAGWMSIQDVYTEPVSLQFAKAVYDPVNNVIVMISTVSGLSDVGYTWIFDINTGQLIENIVDKFPPCDIVVSSCVPSFFAYDANLGVIAGKQGTPSATTIGLYQFDVVTMDWSSATVEILSEADFNYAAFTTLGPMNSSYTIDGITTTMFGGGQTASASPGFTAGEWFIRTGDPGGVTPVERDFDSWISNFLASIGMDSPVGRLLVGSIFSIVMFFVLTIKGVPWIMALGITGLSITTLTAAMIFNPAILLGLIAIVMVGGMGLIFALILGGGDGNG